jgi:hypothetical protein
MFRIPPSRRSVEAFVAHPKNPLVKINSPTRRILPLIVRLLSNDALHRAHLFTTRCSLQRCSPTSAPATDAYAVRASTPTASLHQPPSVPKASILRLRLHRRLDADQVGDHSPVPPAGQGRRRCREDELVAACLLKTSKMGEGVIEPPSLSVIPRRPNLSHGAPLTMPPYPRGCAPPLLSRVWHTWRARRSRACADATVTLALNYTAAASNLCFATNRARHGARQDRRHRAC